MASLIHWPGWPTLGSRFGMRIRCRERRFVGAGCGAMHLSLHAGTQSHQIEWSSFATPAGMYAAMKIAEAFQVDRDSVHASIRCAKPVLDKWFKPAEGSTCARNSRLTVLCSLRAPLVSTYHRPSCGLVVLLCCRAPYTHLCACARVL